MKLLLLIFTFNICSAQYKWTDYDTHFHVSGNISGYATSSYYYLTKKPVLSAFLGVLTGISIGMGKEYIYDKSMGRGTFSTYDIEANVKGAMTYGFFAFGTIGTIERRQQKLYEAKQLYGN